MWEKESQAIGYMPEINSKWQLGAARNGPQFGASFDKQCAKK